MNPDMPDDVEIGCSSSRIGSLVALAATITLLSASTACDWFGLGGCHALVFCVVLASFGVANEFISFDSITDASTCELRRRKFVSLRIAPALERQRFITRSMKAILHADKVMGVEHFGIGGLTAHHKAVKAGAAARAERHDAVAKDRTVRLKSHEAVRTPAGLAVPKHGFHVPVRCCGPATSRKNQGRHHLLAQELGKLPVRNSTSACVVHCVRKSAECPIEPLC
jgi:hypothetical protein